MQRKRIRPDAAWAALVLATAALAGCSAGGGRQPLSAREATGREYHVSPAGNDTGPGTASRPWRTCQHAAEVAGAGDTVVAHPGTYAEDVRFRRSGTAEAPIRFQAAGVAIVRSLQLEPQVSHLRLRGFRVEGYRIWGVTLLGSNRDVRLSGLDVSGGEAGMRFTVGDSGRPPRHGPVSEVVVEDTRVRGARYSGVDVTPGPCYRTVFRRLEVSGSGLGGEDSFGADGLAVERGQHVLVEGCYIHDNGGDGIDLNSRDRTGPVGGIIVRGNTVARNHLNGIKLWAGGRMIRNAVWGQGLAPVMVGAYDCSAALVSNTVAYNMHAAEYGARDYAAVIGYAEGGGGAHVTLTFTRNIFAFNTGPAQGSPTGLYLGPHVQLAEERDNVFFSRPDEELLAAFLGGGEGHSVPRAEIRNGAWARLSGCGQGDLSTNPLFASSWPAVDLHLRPGSPAAGRGAY